MKRFVCGDKEEMGAAAAGCAAEAVRKAIAEKGGANLILATGASQFEMLHSLVHAGGIDWARVVAFHLDEYIDLPVTHPASFRKYIQERFVDKVPALKAVHLINGNASDPLQECDRVGALIDQHPIDVALVGIGENGHLAFNDPPADFETEAPYIVVDLDEACRRQQLGEGWFSSLEEVPKQAVSMSVRQIMKSACIVATVPDERKAEAVRRALLEEISPMCPSSILREHPNCAMFLDLAAASLLGENRTKGREE